MRTRLVWGIATLLAAGSGAASAASPRHAPWFPRTPIVPAPSASARYVHPEFDIDGPRLQAFKAIVGRMRLDSTRNWEVRNGRLHISYDLMQDLAGGALSPGEGRLGEKLSAVLASRGIDLDAPAPAYAQYLPNDSQVTLGPQWAIHNSGAALGGRPGVAGLDIGIEKVWDKFSGSDTLVVAVVDAGFDFLHPDLKGRNWINKAEAAGKPGVDDDGNGYVDDSVGWDFVENDNDPQDYHGHGTNTSSLIAASFDNQVGIAGVLAHARIMPIRVLDASGHGDEASIAKGIQYAVKNGAKAINFSIGGSADNLAMRTAFQAARTAGVPVVVAAGNDAIDLDAHPTYPAAYAYDNMLVVAAHDHAGQLCSFSNYGGATVHLAAPGEFIPACSMPGPIYPFTTEFDTDDMGWDTTGSWRISKVNPIAGTGSLEWVAGNNATITSRDTVDMRGLKGAVLLFITHFKAVNKYDALVVEANKIGTTTWTTIGVLGGEVDSAAIQSVGLTGLDGSRFRLRFRTSLSAAYSSATRIFKIDEIIVRYLDSSPKGVRGYLETSGTSVAAPYVTAYAALLRLACDRMGVPFTRARALEGIDSDADLAGKVATGGRLDIYKGLKFYLQTLPELRVTDSTALAWKTGQKVEYSLAVDPLPADAYAYSVLGMPDGVGIDGAGKLVWTPSGPQAGAYTLRFAAEGPTTLRKSLTIKVDPSDSDPLPLARLRTPAQEWEFGGRRFRFPPEMASGRHLIEVAATDATGRTTLLAKIWMEAPALRPAPALASQPAGFHGWRVRADGIPLASH
jgi:hypothetical protein